MISEGSIWNHVDTPYKRPQKICVQVRRIDPLHLWGVFDYVFMYFAEVSRSELCIFVTY